MRVIMGHLLQTTAWLVFAATAAVLWIRGIWEPRHPEYTETVLGENGATLRVLLLSDLHANLNRVPVDRLIAAVAGCKPDLLLFAGDACSGRWDARASVLLLARLGTAARAEGIPAYAVPGNHDQVLDASAFDGAGIPWLRNRAVEILTARGDRWTLIGLDDRKLGPPRFPAAGDLPAGVPAARTLILSHNPDNVYLPFPGSARFFLCGHFHGGQIWMPIHLEFRLLRREKLAAEGIYRGSFQRNGMFGYISRGIGCVVFPLRLFSRPEISVITLCEGDGDTV